MIRVIQFASLINRYDFIDNIIQYIDPKRFTMGVAVGPSPCNIEEPVFPAGTARWVVPWNARRQIVAASRRLARILREWRADIIHTHHYDEALIGWLATRLYRRTRLVVGHHYSDTIYRTTTGLKRRAFIAAEQVVNRAATRIIVPSEDVVQILTRWQGVEESKVDRIPYGFVPEKYQDAGRAAPSELRRELGLEGRFVVGHFGRLHKVKGQESLIRAVGMLRSRFPGACLVIVGEGPERGNLERLIASLGLGDMVRLLGWRRDAMSLMNAVDIVVQPSLEEGFGQVMAEAFWMAKPLIMTLVGGATDAIRQGETLLIVPKDDPVALADAIGRLAADPSLRDRLATAGREYVSDHLSIDANITRYQHSYIKAMEQEGSDS